MWFVNWYKKNSNVINAFLITSAALGLVSGISAVFFPVVLATVASMPLFAFLVSLPLIAAAPLTGVLTSGVSLAILGFSSFFIRQMHLVSIHLTALFTTQPESAASSVPERSSHILMQPYLKPRVVRFQKEADLPDEFLDFEVEEKPCPFPGTVVDVESLEPSAVEEYTAAQLGVA